MSPDNWGINSQKSSCRNVVKGPYECLYLLNSVILRARTEHKYERPLRLQLPAVQGQILPGVWLDMNFNLISLELSDV